MYNLICKLRNIIGFFLAVLNCFAFVHICGVHKSKTINYDYEIHNHNNIPTIPLNPPLKRGTYSKALPCSPTATENILTRHREELHPMTALIPNLALCNSVAIYLCLYTLLIPPLLHRAPQRSITASQRSKTAEDPHVGAWELPTLPTPVRAPPRGDVFISVVSKTYLTRHREELHLTTSLIPNLALCNSVAIYLCL